MTKSNAANTVYADLTKLLGDINKFLEEQVNGGALKAETLHQALKLIDRSKVQIERIDALTPPNDDYVVMNNNGNVGVAEPENDNGEDDYALVVETKHCEKIRKCDVTELPASEIPRSGEVKCGQLTYHRKTDKWFFRREQYVKVFGAVYDDHLLIYKSEKCEKPMFCLNLLIYRGHEVINSKRCGSFEVTDKLRSYNFIARNEKDMEQWLSKINKLDYEHGYVSEKPRPLMTVSKPKMPLQKRPVPDIPRTSVVSASYINPDGEDSNNYETPGEEQEQVYYVVGNDNAQKTDNKEVEGEYDAYSAVLEEEQEEEDDDKIYAVVVPPPIETVRPLHSSFVHRQTARR